MTFPQTQPPAPTRPSAWTPEREARALRLYLHEGFTASEVAEALGGGFTRGAVIGKVRRLGYAKRERPTTDPAQAAPPRPCRRSLGVERRLPPQRPPIPLPPLREAPATGVPTRLAALDACACRWPLDDPGPGRMHLALFCAGPPSAGSSYCAAHRELARR